MVHAKPTLPAGHGEVLTSPDFATWSSLATRNRDRADAWSFTVAGRPAADVRTLARAEALTVAAAFSAKLDVPLTSRRDPAGLIVATGHQPELYHPGVWIKDFLLQRLADQCGAAAFDLVVDTDGFDSIALTTPCLTPAVGQCRQYLAVGGRDATYGSAPVPSSGDIDDFCSACETNLATLRAPAIRRHFAAFCEELRGASEVAENLAELVTIARRRFEAPAGTDYLELPLTRLVRGDAFALFVADIALSASRFCDAYNSELDEFRSVNKTRSAAQPFPNLASSGERRELPLWSISRTARSAVWVESVAEGGVRLVSAEGELLAAIGPGEDPVAALAASGAVFAPKALLLTLFVRLFCCDLFIHGVGGGRYDSVTDGVCRRYFGVEPPAFAVASITMYLPLGAHIVTDAEVSAATERLNRVAHNPDALLSEVEFDSAEEHDRAVALSAEKSRLVAAIASPDADRKTLGLSIREVNAQLAQLLAPLTAQLTDELATLEAQRDASGVLTDRTYPFCLWSPQEVADKAR